MATKREPVKGGLAILLGGGGSKHKEPDDDNSGGPSDEDADNLPAGALEAYREHVAAEESGDDAGACAALCRLVRIASGESEEPSEETTESEYGETA